MKKTFVLVRNCFLIVAASAYLLLAIEFAGCPATVSRYTNFSRNKELLSLKSCADELEQVMKEWMSAQKLKRNQIQYESNRYVNFIPLKGDDGTVEVYYRFRNGKAELSLDSRYSMNPDSTLPKYEIEELWQESVEATELCNKQL